jgi:hypothetical protein
MGKLDTREYPGTRPPPWHLPRPLAPALPPGTRPAPWHPQGVPLLWTEITGRSVA